LSTHPTRLTSLPAFLPLPKDQASAQRKPFSVGRKCESKHGGDLNSLTEHDLRNCLNIGSIVCSCVSTQKGTILKAVVVDFLNLLNRNIYRHSLVLCVCVCVCVCVCRTSHTVTLFLLSPVVPTTPCPLLNQNSESILVVKYISTCGERIMSSHSLDLGVVLITVDALYWRVSC